MIQPSMIYVLNLDRAPERWRGCQRRLEGLGVWPSMIQRVAGLDALTLWKEAGGPPNQDPRVLKNLVDEGLIREGDNPSISPNFCIAASHLRVLRRVCDEGHAWALILEDDFELTQYCRSWEDLFRFDALPPDADWVWLHDQMWGCRNDRDLYRRAVGGHGMYGQLVSLAGAKIARDALLPVVAPCDLQLPAFSKWFHRPALRDHYMHRKLAWGWRTRQAEKAISLGAYVRYPSLFSHRRGETSLKHQAVNSIYRTSVG